MEPREKCMDTDVMIGYLRAKGAVDLNNMLMDAADMLADLYARHWSECCTIGAYHADEVRHEQ